MSESNETIRALQSELEKAQDELMLLNLDMQKLKQQLRSYEYEQFKLNELQLLSNSGSWQLDHLTYKLHFSESLQKVLYGEEIAQDELPWRDFLNMFDPKDAHIIDVLTDAVMKRGESVTFKHVLHVPAGRSIFVRHYCKTFYNTIGQPLMTIGLLQDINEDENNRLLVERNLKEMEDTRRKNIQMYGVIAHELRTPVATIQMMTQRSDEQWGKDKPAINELTQDLLHAIDDMRLLVNPKLKRENQIESTTIAQLNTSISQMVASSVTISGLLFEQHSLIPAPRLSEAILTDTFRVKAGVVNLIRNACLHSAGTRIKCVSSLCKDNDGREFVTWSVSDDGKGIDDAEVSKLFEPFERGTSEAEGTGLGLYVVKNWIKELGGSASYCKLEQGSEFTLQVPLEYDAYQKPASQPTAQALREMKAIAARMRVLLVEDSEIIQIMTQTMLSPLFAMVDVAGDGEEGIAHFGEHYDLVITDNFMPKMTGVEMIQQIRQQGWSKPIIGVTAATISDEAEHMLDAGADVVLAKPIDINMVLNTLCQLYLR